MEETLGILLFLVVFSFIPITAIIVIAQFLMPFFINHRVKKICTMMEEWMERNK